MGGRADRFGLRAVSQPSPMLTPLPAPSRFCHPPTHTYLTHKQTLINIPDPSILCVDQVSRLQQANPLSAVSSSLLVVQQQQQQQQLFCVYARMVVYSTPSRHLHALLLSTNIKTTIPPETRNPETPKPRNPNPQRPTLKTTGHGSDLRATIMGVGCHQSEAPVGCRGKIDQLWPSSSSSSS
jgi:hypothetical protein